MKIAIIGITGNVGQRIADEAFDRGHTVTGIVRDVAKGEPRANLVLMSGDADNPDALATMIADHDAVISSVPFRRQALPDRRRSWKSGSCFRQAVT